MNNEIYEEELNLASLMYFILSKWKSILLIAIIGLAVGLGIGLIPEAEDDTIARVEDEEALLQDYKIQKLWYQDVVKNIEGLEKYVMNSRLMNMDYYNVHRVSLTYIINCQYADMEQVRAEIRSFIWDGELVNELMETGLYSVREFETLLTYATSEEYSSAIQFDETGKDKSQVIVVDPQSNGEISVKLAIMGETEEEAKLLSSAMRKAINACFAELKTEGLTDGYSLLNESYKVTYSGYLASYHTANVKAYTDAINSRNNYKSTIRSLEKKIVGLGYVIKDGVVTDMNGKEDFAEARDTTETISIKRGIIGAIVGMMFMGLLAIGIFFLVYIFSGRLYAISEKGRVFSVKELASIHDFSNKKGLDLWLAQKLGGIYSELPLEEQRKVAHLNIKNELEKDESIKKLFMVSTLGASVVEVQHLMDRLKADGYQIDGCENVIGRVDVLQKVSACDAVIVVEDNDKSKTALVKEELSILHDYVDNVLGMVVVEG